jgi:hypothetical protein
MAVADHAQEDFMREILGHGLAAGEPEKETEKRPVAVVVNIAHGGQISARDRGHEFMVCWL